MAAAQVTVGLTQEFCFQGGGLAAGDRLQLQAADEDEVWRVQQRGMVLCEGKEEGRGGGEAAAGAE